MKPEENKKPWVELISLIEKGNARDIDQYFESINPSETARIVARIDEDSRKKLLTLLNPQDAAEMLLDLPDEQAADLIEKIEPHTAAGIMDQMPGEEQADILADVQKSSAQAILNVMSEDTAFKARELLEYDEDNAGGLMTTEFLSYPQKATVQEVLDDLRANREKYLDYNVQYTYVTTEDGILKGVLPMRELLLAPSNAPVSSIMFSNPLSVNVYTALDDLIEFFEEKKFLGIPVTDNTGKLLGIVRRGQVMEAEGDRDKDHYLKSSGIIGGEELRSMPMFERSKRRLTWLSVNIVLNILAASVIAMYQDTLSAVIALAVFLPIISDMSGCSGNQAVAVSIRELTLGLIKPYELPRVLLKECGIGVINGIVLGILLGIVAFIWKGNIYLSCVVAAALAMNTFVAVCLGGVIPLILKLMNKDPALASGPILTTVTDMCGFFFTLSFATLLLSRIVL